jgi:para-aminobenzoate synthetase/4-amino-4-deoxychorismate lyase
MSVRGERRALGWKFTPADVLRLVRGDAHPVALFGAWAGDCDVVCAQPVRVRSGPGPLADILDLPFRYPPGEGTGMPAFGGGWIGYLGYSAGGAALPPSGPRRLPAWWFGYYDHALVRDRATGEWFFEALANDDRADARERRFADLSRRASALASPAGAPGYEFGSFRLLPGEAGHTEAVGRAVEYIRQGDIFQANICLRAEASFAGDPLDAFCRAAAALEPPYAAFISVSDGPGSRSALASLSPELFLRRQAGTVVSKPIKGTARRAADAELAAGQLAGLERSAKDRAENVMIVDLVRNDLARVCLPGSVTVPDLLAAEPHPGVWHLVSTVAGTLVPGTTDGDLIRAAFPPGSVTGAPKVRALEVIDEIEISPREVYTGAIGYRSPVAGLELNVAIRTFEFAAGRAWLGAGGGIVADSDPATEYAECLIKATPLLTAIGARLDVSVSPPPAEPLPRPSAGVFTSLLVSGGETRGLPSHLARLEASVRDLYGKDLPASLLAQVSAPGWSARLAAQPSGRLRITVRPVGGPLQATIEVIALPPAQPGPAGITLRPVTVPGGIGAHKWRDRRLLAELAARAGLAAGEQLLLTDETGELLETDRGNVGAVIDGVLLTPPADGRLLPGTTRSAVMRAAHAAAIKVGQKPLTLDQLAAATEVFVTNAVAALAAALTARPPDPVPLTRPLDPSPRPPLGGRGVSGHRTGGAPGGPLIVLVDNYDSFTWNLAHLLSISGARVEVVRNDEVTAAQVADASPAGVVISPGPCAPAEAGISIDVVRRAAGIPLLGVCLGHQAIAAAFGAAIIRAPRPVHGQAGPISHDGRGVLAGLPDPFPATRYHSLIIDEATLPPELVITARSGTLPMGVRHASAPIEGVQFHPESILTTHGEQLIRTFVRAAGRTANGE